LLLKTSNISAISLLSLSGISILNYFLKSLAHRSLIDYERC